MPLNSLPRLVLTAALSCVLYGNLAFAANPQVVIPKIVYDDIDHDDYYFSRLLTLALTRTQTEHGKTLLVEQSHHNADRRARAELLAKNIDVMWSPTSADLESEFLAVKVSLLKDISDYRLLLIRPEMQPEFSKVKALNDLRRFRGGIGSHWVDTEIMEANNLPLVKAVGYDTLFKMLAAKRFDYFSRGLYQIQAEASFYPELHLTIEKELMLHYPNDIYFFVHRENSALAERLKIGLEAALADGSFQQLYDSIPRYKWAMEVINKQGRRVIKLNPVTKK
jgi:hypothetical protein